MRKVDAATRDEALRRVGLLGLGVMVLGGAGPAGALDGGAGGACLLCVCAWFGGVGLLAVWFVLGMGWDWSVVCMFTD